MLNTHGDDHVPRVHGEMRVDRDLARHGHGDRDPDRRASDPDAGDTVTLAFGLVIVKLTGPPTAVRMNVPLAGLPLTAVSTSLFGATRRVPGVGGGDDDGDGDGDGEEVTAMGTATATDGDGEDRRGR